MKILRSIFKSLRSQIFPLYADLSPRLEAIEIAFQTLADNNKYESDEFSLNRQEVRRAITSKILTGIKFDFIVETGTYTGNSTGYFSKFNAKVISSEISKPLYFVAKQRLAGFSNVNVRLSDSRNLLRELIVEKVNLSPTFFYLDAHWLNDLPLLEEIKIIDENWTDWIVLIDDFEVPNDSGYGFDDYGKGKVLNYEYIEKYVLNNSIDVYFPNVLSTNETGYKRGYTFLSKGSQNSKFLGGIGELSLYKGK
ncbi:MAG: hypothetical protein WCI39_07225 [Gallionellaceae bacterium]